MNLGLTWAQEAPGAWAVASDNLSEVASQAAALELDSREIIDMSRTTPEGVELAWRLLFLRDSHMPFFIDWLESPHPALSTPSGCTLERFNITTPTPAVYQRFLDALDLPCMMCTPEFSGGEVCFLSKWSESTYCEGT